MKIALAAGVTLFALTGCASEPPSFEECARTHIEILQDKQRNGFAGPDVKVMLEEEGCGVWYGEELNRRSELLFPPAEPGYVDPLHGADEGRPPDNSERDFSCSSPEVGVTVCEGNVPDHIDHITPEEYNG